MKEDMLTSKDLLRNTGISRATLNNYISLGILPRPQIRKAAPGDGAARRIGYFPHGAVDTINRVNDLKRRKVSMALIPDLIHTPDSAPIPDSGNVTALPQAGGITPPAPGGGQGDNNSGGNSGGGQGDSDGGSRPPGASAFDTDQPLRLTVGDLDYPAYLINSNFEVEWSNNAADQSVLGHDGAYGDDISAYNILHMLLNSQILAQAEDREELIRFHLSIAKKRMSRMALSKIGMHLDGGDMEALIHLYDNAETVESREMQHTELNLAPPGEPESWHNVYASFFREGVFFVFLPSTCDGDSLLNLLARRDVVIRDLLKNRRPCLTPLSVLVADLQGSMKICAELPPEEYFELINDIWGAMEPKLRKFYATHGKHVGDGMLYYFFPQPDCSYVLNAIECAQEMKETMRDISRRWRKRKNWLNDLKLNIGLQEGEEWFGSYQTPTHIEFTVLGDSINQAARLSDFATGGTVWATKSMIGKLDVEDRELVTYGIRRVDAGGGEILIPETYSRISNLIDLNNPQFNKFNDIAVLTVTEVLDVESGDMAGTDSGD